MKTLLAIFLALFSLNSHAGFKGYFTVGTSDTETKKPSLILSVGSEEWLFSIGAVFNSEYGSDDFVDTTIPHNDYQDLGEKRIGTTYGFDVNRVFTFSNDTLPSAYLGGGMYWTKRSHLVRSNATGMIWQQETKTSTRLGANIGVIWNHAETDKTKFGAGYSSTRGFELMIGRDYDW